MSFSLFARGVIAIALSMALGCRNPDIQEVQVHAQPGLSQTDYLALSPVIVVAEIRSDFHKIGWSRRSSRYKSDCVQLVGVAMNIEVVLQGRISPGTHNVYFFVKLGNIGGMSPIVMSPGDRFILYLQKESGEWRLRCDYHPTCVDLVLTGRHSDFKRNPHRPIADDILAILFTRGESTTDGQMVDALAGLTGRGGGSYGYRWIDRHETAWLTLLQQIAATETPPVRAEACQLLKDLGKPCEVYPQHSLEMTKQ